MTKRLKELSFSQSDRLFAVFSLICGFLYWNLGNMGMGAGATLLVFALVIWGILYMHIQGFVFNRRSIPVLILILLCGINLLIFDNVAERSLAFIFAHVLYIYWIAVTTGNTVEGRLSLYTLVEMIRKIFFLPFVNFGALWWVLFKGKKSVNGTDGSLPEQGRGRKSRSFLLALVGLVIALPILIGVIRLLMEADENFAMVLISIPTGFSRDILWNMGIYFFQFLMGIPVAMYLYGYFTGEMRNRYALASKEAMDLAASQVAVIPGATVYAVLIALDIVYLIFCGVQGANLLGAFSGILPQGATYAEFARGGFFQLCQVAVINGVICGFSYVFIKDRRKKMFRILTGVTAGFTLLLCMTAISKMFLYIEAYGLTRLRIFTLWFMILLLAVFAAVLIRQIIVFNGFKWVCIIFTLLFMILIYGNVDGQIAKYNLQRYEAGTLKEMDGKTMMGLSAGAAPYLMDAYDRVKDEDFRLNIEPALEMSAWDNERHGWKDFNIQSRMVQGEVEKYIKDNGTR